MPYKQATMTPIRKKCEDWYDNVKSCTDRWFRFWKKNYHNCSINEWDKKLYITINNKRVFS